MTTDKPKEEWTLEDFQREGLHVLSTQNAAVGEFWQYPAVERWLRACRELERIRKEHAGKESVEEDTFLVRMDVMWARMSTEQIALVEQIVLPTPEMYRASMVKRYGVGQMGVISDYVDDRAVGIDIEDLSVAGLRKIETAYRGDPPGDS